MCRAASVLGLLTLLLVPAHSEEAQVRLLTDDAIPRYLQRGRELAKDKQWSKMVDVLQRVVLGDKDIFPDLKPEMLNSAVYSEDDQVFYPARELCLLEMAKLPPEGLQAYRDAFDAEAKALFKDARAVTRLPARLAKYAEVYDHYLVSTVGDDALEAALDLNLALGRYFEGLALCRRLVDIYPKDTDRDIATVMAKAAHCAARIGNTEVRDLWLGRAAAEYPRARVLLEGRPVPTPELGGHPALAVTAARPDAGRDWPIAGGTPARSRATEDIPEDLPRRPFWAFPIGERDARLLVNGHDEWSVVKHHRQKGPEPDMNAEDNNALRPYPTVRPVVHDGLVFYRDYNELVTRWVGSGHFRGLHFVTPESPPSAEADYVIPAAHVRPGVRDTGQQSTKYETAYRFLEYGGNSVVVTDDFFVGIETRREPDYLTSVAEPHIGLRNFLSVYGRDDGKIVWAWDPDLASQRVRHDSDVFEAWMQDWQLHPAPFFRGPGVADSGLLYTIAHWENDRGEVALWAFDLADGRVRFRTPLHYPDSANRRLPIGASLAVSGGVVYVITNAGVIAAVDALPPGRIRWIRRYDRSFGPDNAQLRNGRWNLVGRGRPSRIHQGFAYNDPVVAEGKLVVAAPDSNVLYGLEAETGRVLWSHARGKIGSPFHIVGVSQGVVVLAGADDAVGIDLAKGTKLWQQRLAGMRCFGRGIVGGDYAYVPTEYDHRHAALERFHVRSGDRAPALEFDVPRLGNVLFVDGRLIAATDKEVMCFTSYEREVASLAGRIRTEGDAAKLRLARAYAALAAQPPRRAEADADFRAALKLAPHHFLREAIFPEAIENLLAAAREQRAPERLEEARALLATMLEETPRPRAEPHPYAAQIALVDAEVHGAAGRGEEALQAIERFLDEFADVRVRVGERAQKAPFAAGVVRDGLLGTSAKFRSAFEQSVRDRIRAAYAAQDKGALQRLPERYGRRHPSGDAYFALAKLCEETGSLSEAGIALRRFIDEFRDDRRRAEAHLRLALVLARKEVPIEARNQREQGVALLDEQGRQETVALLEELDKLLPGVDPVTLKPRVVIPLVTRAFPLQAHAPVQIEGALPAGLEGVVVLASETEYVAVDAGGDVLWRQPNPAGQGAEPGAGDEPSTAEAAAAIAGARRARVTGGGDLLLADVTGLMRVDARSGEVRWRYPRHAPQAMSEARHAIDLLRADLKALRGTGDPVARRLTLPAFAFSGRAVVRVHPKLGVEAFDAASGGLLWQDQQVKDVPVGPPAVMGQLLAVGWPLPGRVRIYDITEGRVGREWMADEKTGLGAPPVLDPLGRLILLTRTVDDRLGKLHILNAHDLEPAFDAVGAIADPLKAAILHADGRMVVYHGGNSSDHGDENIHFLDLDSGERTSVRGTDMLREFTVLRDGARLFVFTWRPGDAGVGARLFRLDLQSHAYLRYSWPLPFGPAHARPALTQRYVVLAWSGRRSAYVRFYDREASDESRQPQPVFLDGGKESAELNIESEEGARYRVPPAVALAGDRAVVSTPFGTVWLQGK